MHACGFDSIPHDLGALFTVEQLPEGVPLRVRGMVRSNATFSGGTFASALHAFSRARQMKRRRAERRAVEPGRRGPAGAHGRRRRPHLDRDAGYWLVPLPTIDPFVVRRSAAALERYGPDFTYGHYAAVKRLPTVVGGMARRRRRWLSLRRCRRCGASCSSRVPAGRGPERGAARAGLLLGALHRRGRRPARSCTEVRGGDPGYTETAKMLAESALCLAFDDNPATAGQVTTASPWVTGSASGWSARGSRSPSGGWPRRRSPAPGRFGRFDPGRSPAP